MGRKRKLFKEKIVKKKRYKNIYKVIVVVNNKQKKCFGTYKTEKDAYEKFNEVVEGNNNVNIPVEYTTQTIVKKTSYDVLIIKNKTPLDKDTSRFRNEYGEFVEYKTNTDEWIVFDKAPFLKEEKFWVWGYNSKSEKKNCEWIYDEFITKYAINFDNFLNIYVYKNKVLFDTTEKFNMVICKVKSDAIRLYNYLENRFKNDKNVKHALFSGSVMISNKRKEMCIEKIRKLTNWKDYQIYHDSTRWNTTEYKDKIKPKQK